MLNLRTLIVEDNVGSAKILAILFSQLGQTQVELAHSGRDAVAKAESFRPEVVILDLVLGDLSGLEVAKTLRKLPEGRDILLVALSGHDSPDYRGQTEEAGFDLHLAKPASVDQVKDVIALGVERATAANEHR